MLFCYLHVCLGGVDGEADRTDESAQAGTSNKVTLKTCNHINHMITHFEIGNQSITQSYNKRSINHTIL